MLAPHTTETSDDGKPVLPVISAKERFAYRYQMKAFAAKTTLAAAAFGLVPSLSANVFVNVVTAYN
jgi:hypothetical protein